MVAMSGGVDSSVAAAILKNDGIYTAGVTLKLHRDGEENMETSCCSSQDIEDARNIAKMLGTGLMQGTDDGRFMPKGTLTKAQTATILRRLSDYVKAMKEGK